MKKLLALAIMIMLLFSGCNLPKNEIVGTKIHLSDSKITIDGKKITNDKTQSVYSQNDIVFYPEGKDFKFGEGDKKDEHTQEEADKHTVVHITKPGNYVLSGKLSSGQIAVDLGEDSQENPDAVVTLILNDVDITCTVAPAVIFYNVYECGVADEEKATKDVDTTKAGANVIIADNSRNLITGSYVAKIYKSYELNEDGTKVTDSKKLHKYDAAFYSKQTMNINGGKKGNGVLNITAENEGLDSELHLTINGGLINITSGNDGINTNEDNVSVTTINGGSLNIICNGKTGEGDGIDSNGWLVINGGTVNAQACSTSGDAGIDSDKGIYINGGKVIATGNMLDRIAGGNQTYAVFSFSSRQSEGNTYTIRNSDGKDVYTYTPSNAFTHLIVAGDKLVEGDYTFWQGNTQLTGSSTDGTKMDKPDGFKPQMPENFTPHEDAIEEKPNGFAPPENENGEDPKKPNKERPQKPDGEIPQMPDGAENMTPPEFFDKNIMPNSETSTIFTIVKGGNLFSNISIATDTK